MSVLIRRFMLGGLVAVFVSVLYLFALSPALQAQSNTKTALEPDDIFSAAAGQSLTWNVDSVFFFDTLWRHQGSIAAKIPEGSWLLGSATVSASIDEETSFPVFHYTLGFAAADLKLDPQKDSDKDFETLTLNFIQSFDGNVFTKDAEEQFEILKAEKNTIKGSYLLSRLFPAPMIESKVPYIAENCDPQLPGRFYSCPKQGSYKTFRRDIVQASALFLASGAAIKLHQLYQFAPHITAISMTVPTLNKTEQETFGEGTVVDVLFTAQGRENSGEKYELRARLGKTVSTTGPQLAGTIEQQSSEATRTTQQTTTAPASSSTNPQTQSSSEKSGCATQPSSPALLVILGLMIIYLSFNALCIRRSKLS